MALDVTTSTYVPDNLLAGQEVDLIGKSAKLKGGQGTLLRGSVLGAITDAGADLGKFVLLDKTAVDGSADIASADLVILAEDTDTMAGDVIAPVYQAGVFNKAAVSFTAGTVADDYLLPLQFRSIYLKDVGVVNTGV